MLECSGDEVRRRGMEPGLQLLGNETSGALVTDQGDGNRIRIMRRRPLFGDGRHFVFFCLCSVMEHAVQTTLGASHPSANCTGNPSRYPCCCKPNSNPKPSANIYLFGCVQVGFPREHHASQRPCQPCLPQYLITGKRAV